MIDVRCLGLFLLISASSGQVTLFVPAAGNCGDDTVLTCNYTISTCSIWLFKRGNIELVSITNPTSDKYEGMADVAQKTLTLTIKNMEKTDEGSYKCYCGFNDFDEKLLSFECKPTEVTKRIREDKRLEVSFHLVYPNPASVSVTVNSNPQPGTHTCTGSTSTSYNCTWTSSSSLEDVDGGYRVVVKTVTETALSGSIKIATPSPPNVTNREQLSDGRSIIRATEDSQVALTCVSSGGIPAPTVAWYKDSISTAPLKSISTGVEQGDGTYTVTLTHTITASRSDDLGIFVCRSYYPQADSTVTQGSRETSVKLYLNLKPSYPTIINQTNTPVSTGTVTLQCRTSGGRPAPSVTWTYRGQTLSPQVQSDKDDSTETYSVMSTLQRQVTAEDNGEQATCHVNNTALTAELTSYKDIAVKFPVSPSSTVITGNMQVIATGSNPLNLNCTTGSSNPASNITWRRGSTVITNSNPVNSWTGTNRGKVTSQILTLRPTRDNDSEVITCSVTNSDSAVATSQGGAVNISVTLNLTYSPKIQSMTGITVDEGQVGVVLSCIVSSKPVSTITWSRSGSSPVQGQGTATGDGYNSFNYTLTTVSRNDQGTYRCRADNQIGTADIKDVVVAVRYVTVTAINSTTDSSSTTVTCTLNSFGGSFDPRPWVQKWQNSNGEYVEVNSRPFTRTLNLTSLTYQHSGVYICMVKADVSGAISVQGNTSLLIKAPPIILQPKVNQTRHRVAGRLNHNATVSVQYYSNVPGSEVKCYRSNNNVRSPNPVGHTTLSEVTVQLPVFSHIVPTPGTMATVTIMINSEDDFGDYNITITNGIGPGSALLISVIPQGPPDAPMSVEIVTYGPDTATLQWVPGYHGGLNQTFVIQLSQDEMTWFNKTFVHGGQDLKTTVSTTLDGLTPSTMYYVRLSANNAVGQSENYTTVLKFTTKDAPSGSSPAALIGGIGGGAAVVIIIGVIVAVLLIRKRKQSKGDNTELMNRRRESDSDDYVTENAQYASADQMESPASGSATYAVVDKKKKKGPDPSALYAVPDKPKRGGPKPDALYATPDKKKKNNAPDPNALYAMPEKKKGVANSGFDASPEKKKGGTPKGKKPKPKAPAPDADVYENAPEFAVQNKKKGKNASKDESVYEDTTVPPLMPKPKPKKNKDGLVYADLTFNKTANGKDAKIHGLENATTYMEVDFSKKAKPLPESDDE